MKEVEGFIFQLTKKFILWNDNRFFNTMELVHRETIEDDDTRLELHFHHKDSDRRFYLLQESSSSGQYDFDQLRPLTCVQIANSIFSGFELWLNLDRINTSPKLCKEISSKLKKQVYLFPFLMTIVQQLHFHVDEDKFELCKQNRIFFIQCYPSEEKK